MFRLMKKKNNILRSYIIFLPLCMSVVPLFAKPVIGAIFLCVSIIAAAAFVPAFKCREKLADVLFGLDIDFDTVEGEGDIMVDDILIAVSEEEEFFKKIGGRRCMYIVEGKFI